MPEKMVKLLTSGIGLIGEDVDRDRRICRYSRPDAALLAGPAEAEGTSRSRSFIPALLRKERAFSTSSRSRTFCLHHPYTSFSTVTDFIAEAAEDPDVQAIKICLYRTGKDSPIVDSLMRASRLGKQVTALVELKARFDEENNIEWARRLENEGVHVVYGISTLKTHSKVLLVVRREKDKLVRYVHLATGNYNRVTARVYTDLGTADRGRGDRARTRRACSIFYRIFAAG